MTERVRLSVSNNIGYSDDQITDTMTLGDLLAAVTAAIEEHGPDCKIVTVDSGNRYGANFGAISTYEDTFTAVPDADCDVCGGVLERDADDYTGHDPECPNA